MRYNNCILIISILTVWMIGMLLVSCRANRDIEEKISSLYSMWLFINSINQIFIKMKKKNFMSLSVFALFALAAFTTHTIIISSKNIIYDSKIIISTLCFNGVCYVLL